MIIAIITTEKESTAVNENYVILKRNGSITETDRTPLEILFC